MQDELTKDILNVLVKHNVIPSSVPVWIRDNEIRQEYNNAKVNEDTKNNLKIVREHLAQKYFLSEKQIETILYKQ